MLYKATDILTGYIKNITACLVQKIQKGQGDITGLLDSRYRQIISIFFSKILYCQIRAYQTAAGNSSRMIIEFLTFFIGMPVGWRPICLMEELWRMF